MTWQERVKEGNDRWVSHARLPCLHKNQAREKSDRVSQRRDYALGRFHFVVSKNAISPRIQMKVE